MPLDPLNLTREASINREARAEWDDSYWSHWASIQRVIIGGGMNRGKLGLRVAHHAQEFLHRYGLPEMTVERADRAEALPLIGAARYAPAEASTAMLYDFGQTQVKTAFGTYEDGKLSEVRTGGSFPSECDTQNLYAEGSIGEAQHRAEWMLLRMRARDSSRDPLVIVCGIASYVQHGQPADRGCYGVLGLISDSVERYFADRLSAELKRPVMFRLLHDGTAAAGAYVGADHAAVITMGTALGIGFPPPAEIVRSLSASFVVK